MDMSLSLPGNDLYYLPRDNLPPEEYERIISAYAAWSRICREYQLDDRNNNGHYIINMRENRAASHSRPSREAREKDKLKNGIFRRYCHAQRHSWPCQAILYW